MKNDYDVIIIGGGAAGLFAADAAINQRASTCLVEKKKLGGDCTWKGCIPSKALLKSSKNAEELKHHEAYGLHVDGEFHLDYSGVMKHVRAIREEIGKKETSEIYKQKGVEVIHGAPVFTGPGSVAVNGRSLTSKRFIICTGTHPVVPPIEGLDAIDYYTNENLFEIDSLPQSLLVLGGGPIGIELSQAFNRLGVEVTVVEMSDRILSVEDKEISDFVTSQLKKEGIHVLTGRKAVAFDSDNSSVTATLEDKNGHTGRTSAAKLLVAIGRAPNIDGLSLEEAGIDFSKKGITTNDYLQTTNSRVFACGDVAGPYMFTHVAAYQAYICVRNALYRKIAHSKVDYRNIAWANFIEPEIGHLGLTEHQARQDYDDVHVYRTDYSDLDRACTDVAGDGMLKVITDKKGYILGAHAAGSQASEIIHPLVIAQALRIKFSRLAKPMFIYPTLSEIVKKTAAQPLKEYLDRPLIRFFLRLLRKV
ncbi:MAG: FAD-dependent oxidoreductase [Desulfobulbaceae bacterium]|nr:FAD-dependent oxidoreductase [Desulfobulbaceae bacterium]